LAQGPPEEVKFLEMSHEIATWGPPVAPSLGDGDKLVTALTSTNGRLTNLKESPF